MGDTGGALAARPTFLSSARPETHFSNSWVGIICLESCADKAGGGIESDSALNILSWSNGDTSEVEMFPSATGRKGGV